jgi:DNA-binding IscR family transcriptional regulator
MVDLASLSNKKSVSAAEISSRVHFPTLVLMQGTKALTQQT